MKQQINTSVADNIIVGRVEPHIYAFETGTIPNYLKVGDTYRPVRVRIEEWQRYFADLSLVYSHSARIDKETIFRDYAVHKFLEKTKQRQRLRPEEIPSEVYYSNEFFKNACSEDIEEAIEDIHQSAKNGDNRYQFYNNDRLTTTTTFERNKSYKPRSNQQEVIDKFVTAVQHGRTNLLMYAVMRFGKTFTALCCAKEKVFGVNKKERSARLILVVSGKGDVRYEWKKNVESIIGFEDFVFLDKDSLIANDQAISSTLSKGKKAVIFLTLQDLQGDDIKKQHEEIFSREIDLLIIDETHYGARAEEYGRVLQQSGLSKKQISSELESYDETTDELDQHVKRINAQIRLHLSGTPYRILMGDEFEKEDIIAFYQFADIVEEQQKWDRDHFTQQESNNNEHTELKEWDNPYFGFPQMIRFAFNPSSSARKKMEEIKKNGYTFAFSELFRPLSMTKQTNGNHKRFEHEAEILDIFRAIDGSKNDENILSILDYDKIQNGNMCRHIICVLPFRTSCDALEELLKNNKQLFKHLKRYNILNIAGYDSPFADISDYKSAINSFESKGEKTISLSVNKFLTGSTIEQWDTMLYFKDTASPQEYDQAIFRLQSQYITIMRQGEEEIKINMKPQTILVDFDPNRMFYLQELKSLFYNTNTNLRGNDDLKKRIERELKISPIIIINKDRLQQIEPTNIIDSVRNYQKNKSIVDEALDIPFDKSLLEIDEIKRVISSLSPIDSKKGIEIAPAEGNGIDISVPTDSPMTPNAPATENNSTSNTPNSEEKLKEKLASYYIRILFYAFLTHDKVSTLKQLVKSISSSDDNKRIANNVGLNLNILQLIFDNAEPFKLSHLDGKIENVNSQARDTSIPPTERATIAMNKFSRISDSEVVMPQNVATDMIDFIKKEDLSANYVILDMASKQGEMAYAFRKKYPSENRIKFYSIATSPLTYELTRRVYEFLGLDTNFVLPFTSFSLLGERSQQIIEQIKQLEPNFVLLAPPYHKLENGGRKNSGNASAIYHYFFNIAKQITPEHIALFVKSNWYSGGRGEGLSEFRQGILTDQHTEILHDYPDPSTYIDNQVALRGGVCRLLWTSNYIGKCTVINHINGETFISKRPLQYKKGDILIRFNTGLDILRHVEKEMKKHGEHFVHVMPRNPFDIKSNTTHLTAIGGAEKCRIYLPKGQKKYIPKRFIPSYDEKATLINSWKVLVAKASPGEDKLPHSVISEPFVSEPGSLCTDSHLLVSIVENEQQARNMVAYMKTRFFRFMMILAKNNQNMNRETFRFVPLVDLNKQWNDIMLYQHYNIMEYKDYIEKLVNEPRHI